MKRIVGVTASRDAAGGASGAAASDGGGARRACSRCGRAGHGPARCRFKQYTCDNCGQKGHLKVVCQNYKSVSDSEYQKHHKDKNSSELNNDNRKAQSPPLYPTEPSHSQSLKPQPEKYVSHGMTLRPRKKVL
ncbi:unnamed protein product, partial [Brenthis ino]